MILHINNHIIINVVIYDFREHFAKDFLPWHSLEKTTSHLVHFYVVLCLEYDLDKAVCSNSTPQKKYTHQPATNRLHPYMAKEPCFIPSKTNSLSRSFFRANLFVAPPSSRCSSGAHSPPTSDTAHLSVDIHACTSTTPSSSSSSSRPCAIDGNIHKFTFATFWCHTCSTCLRDGDTLLAAAYLCHREVPGRSSPGLSHPDPHPITVLKLGERSKSYYLY